MHLRRNAAVTDLLWKRRGGGDEADRFSRSIFFHYTNNYQDFKNVCTRVSREGFSLVPR